MSIEKEFVPYNESLELKELGFNEPCIATIDQTEFVHINGTKYPIRGSMMYYQIPAPTFSQAFRFFRDKYKIHYSIDYECSQHDYKWGYNWSIYNYNQVVKTEDEYITSHPNAPVGEWIYENPEEAELACLRKLIEICRKLK